jgi:hypothetical protein
MQAVTYNCDVCGVKLPVVPPETSSKTEDQKEFSHFVMVLNLACVRATFLKLGDGPSHGRHRIDEPKQLDVCKECGTYPLTYIIQKATERANGQGV